MRVNIYAVLGFKKIDKNMFKRIDVCHFRGWGGWLGWYFRVERKRTVLRERLRKMEIDIVQKEDLKTVALGTSKINYMDPRISIAWCKRHDVSLEKVRFILLFKLILFAKMVFNPKTVLVMIMSSIVVALLLWQYYSDDITNEVMMRKRWEKGKGVSCAFANVFFRLSKLIGDKAKEWPK